MPSFPRLSYVCPIDWNNMRGDERERFCAKCQRTVTNLSLLTEAQREALLAQERANPGSVCVAYYQRLSGEFVTPEKPLTRSEGRRVVQIGGTVAMAAGLTLAANQAPVIAHTMDGAHKAATTSYQKYCQLAATRGRELVEQVKDYFGIAPKPPATVTLIAGMMVCPPASPAPASPPPSASPPPTPP